jgi:hypothetical protein
MSDIIVFIETDPMISHRPCEGVRMALGLAACNHSVSLILANQAPLLLTDAIEEIIDGEMAQQYLAMLKKFVPVFVIDKKSYKTLDLQSEYKVMILDRNEIAKKIVATECFIPF